MNRIVTIVLIIFISCITAIRSISQPITSDQYRTVLWSAVDGLVDGGNLMLKDKNGFLWLASSYGELNRFDGATFKKYFPHKRGVNPGGINSLIEDSLNNIWMGTDIGLTRYDLRADTFANFYTAIDSKNSVGMVRAFWSTKKFIYCIESGTRIVSYDIYTLRKNTLLTFSDGEKKDMVHLSLSYTILDTISNSLWMLEEMSINPHKGRLSSVSLSDGKKENYEWQCYIKNNKTHRHSAEAMKLDGSRNSIWINSGDGLLEFSLADKHFRHIKAMQKFTSAGNYDRYVGIDLDKNGRVWLATQPSGLLIYDASTDSVMQPTADKTLQKETGESNLDIYCDREGNTWVSDYLGKGVYELLPFYPVAKEYRPRPDQQDSLSSGSIVSIVPAENGTVWLGTKDGINIFNEDSGKFQVLRERDLPGIKGPTIVPIYVDTIYQRAIILAGSADPSKRFQMKCFAMDLKTRKCSPVIFKEASKEINSLTIEPTWVGAYKGGLLICSDGHGIFDLKIDSIIATLVIPSKSFARFLLVSDSLVFILNGNNMSNSTFEKTNGNWVRRPHMLDSMIRESMIYSAIDRSYWVSFKEELVHYDKHFKIIRAYTENDGYKASIFTMEIDNKGDLWFTNKMGDIGLLHVQSGLFTTLSERDNFRKQKYYYFDPSAKNSRGNLFFGSNSFGDGIGSLNCIYPDRYSASSTSQIYFRSVTVNQKSFPFNTGINNVNEFNLKYNQNTFNIETGIIDLSAKGSGHVRFKLEGGNRNEDWQIGPAYYTVRYAGLQPGRYTLLLQASNANNEFLGPVKTVVINIDPPFWQTWWFRILAAVFVLAGIYAYVSYRSRNLRRKNIELEEKVIVRTKELKHSLEDLRETQQQLIQSEKMASLGELTAGIAHEIQNPLNFVNNFSEVNNELITELEQEMENGNLEEVKSLAKELKVNEQKISHHGKRADAIVRGMLQHSRTSKGQVELTDINALVDEHLRLAYHGMRAKDKDFNVILRTDFDHDAGVTKIIPQDIGRVILNLLNNAFYAVADRKKKNEEGYEPKVIISTKRQNSKENTIEISIKDNGAGIPEAIKSKIFQPFFTTKPTGNGTGLGLSLTYDIVKAHGGEIIVNSQLDNGTEFSVYLPVKE